MKTDKQVYTIFTANPRWLFELTGLDWPGPCQWKSVAFKAIERTADGVIFPDADEQLLTVAEFQAQYDKFIYNRIVIEMAMLQELAGNRQSQGIIIFFDDSLDPRTEPFCQIVQAFYLDRLIGDLAIRDPKHPLVAVFRPLLVENEQILEKQAAEYYNQIKASDLPAPSVKVLLDVFVNWLEQRLSSRGKEEIEKMLIGTLPDLRETQSGKDLIHIGKLEGKAEGKQEGKLEGKIEGKLEGKIEDLLMLLEARFGSVPESLRAKISGLRSTSEIDRLLLQVVQIETLDQLTFSP